MTPTTVALFVQTAPYLMATILFFVGCLVALAYRHNLIDARRAHLLSRLAGAAGFLTQSEVVSIVKLISPRVFPVPSAVIELEVRALFAGVDLGNALAAGDPPAHPPAVAPATVAAVAGARAT